MCNFDRSLCKINVDEVRLREKARTLPALDAQWAHSSATHQSLYFNRLDFLKLQFYLNASVHS